MIDTQALRAKLESKLARQQAALQNTIDEISTITTFQHSTDAASAATVQPALEALYVKRMRNTRALAATQGYLKALDNIAPAPKKGKP